LPALPTAATRFTTSFLSASQQDWQLPDRGGLVRPGGHSSAGDSALWTIAWLVAQARDGQARDRIALRVSNAERGGSPTRFSVSSAHSAGIGLRDGYHLVQGKRLYDHAAVACHGSGLEQRVVDGLLGSLNRCLEQL
jgi:hypothetical protein